MKSPLNDALDRKWIEASATTTKLERDLAALREQLAERENWDRLRGEEARRLANEIAEARRTRDVVLSANVNITMERDQIRKQLAERDAEIAALKGHAERMMVEIEDLISLAAIAMHAANNNGGEFDECSELQSARDAVSDYRAACPEE